MEENFRQQPKDPNIGHRFGSGKERFLPTAKPNNAKGTMLRIVRIYMKWAKSLFLVLFFTIIISLTSIAIPYYIGQTINTFHIMDRSVDKHQLVLYLLIITILYIGNWICNFENGIVILKMSQKLVYTLRSEFFQKMQRLTLDFYDTRSHGDTMSRITNDVDNISSTIAQTTFQLLSSIITLTGSFVIMIWLNLWLTMVVLLSVPLVSLLTKTIIAKSRRFFLEQQNNLGKLNGITEEKILGFKMVKAYGKQTECINQFKAVNEQLYVCSFKAQVWSGFMMPLMNVINNLIFAVVAITGGLLSVRYGLAVGTVVSFLSYSKQFAQPLNALAGMFNTIQSALAGAERVFDILDQKEEEPDNMDSIELTNPSGEVSFEEVSFSYNKRNQILNNISFQVNTGQVIALVGETGAGKTTIVNLLTRFYDVDSGNIKIDGIPITNIKRESLRHCFSVVLQDTCLFSGTIMDNIRYSQKNATDEDVICAAKIACAHSFIEKLPKGYMTRISATMENLSQGQKQLLSIARAVLCNSPILILDEATSSVDTKTEKQIQKALVQLMQNRTSFVIAHRLSTIRDADCILVIGNGQILERGNHEELINLKGKYYQMVMSQMGRHVTDSYV